MAPRRLLLRRTPGERGVVAAWPPIRRCTIESKKNLFAINDGTQAFRVAGRAAAIERAKEVSARTWRQVGLERADGRVRMQFRRGVLLTYRYETV